MNTKGSVTVLFLCFLTLYTLTDCSTCNTNKVVGDSLTFTVTDRALKEDDRLSLNKDNKILLKKSSVKDFHTINKIWELNKNSLKLKQVNLIDAGSYTFEAFDAQGTRIKLLKETVCVYGKVPKPRVNITCQNEQIDFTCDVEVTKDQSSNISYSWQKKKKEINNAVNNVLINMKADNSEYTCTVHNPVHKNTSDPVEAACYKSTLLFGFNLWIMVSILAGGGVLVLILTIVLVTLACRACRRREKQQQDEEEFRLNYLQTSSPHGPQKSKQTARGQPAPPEPYDAAFAQEVPSQAEPKPRTQQRGRPPPPPIDDEEEQPPPLPQPRKKAQPKMRAGPM